VGYRGQVRLFHHAAKLGRKPDQISNRGPCPSLAQRLPWPAHYFGVQIPGVYLPRSSQPHTREGRRRSSTTDWEIGLLAQRLLAARPPSIPRLYSQHRSHIRRPWHTKSSRHRRDGMAGGLSATVGRCRGPLPSTAFGVLGTVIGVRMVSGKLSPPLIWWTTDRNSGNRSPDLGACIPPWAGPYAPAYHVRVRPTTWFLSLLHVAAFRL
jgi:hypothetical protein